MNQLNFFSDGSPFLAHPLLTAERTKKECDFIESTLNLIPGSRLLDVGCGYGRHSIELAGRGYDVVGIDASEAMVRAAQELAAKTAVSVDFHVIKAERFQTSTPFDAAICLFTTLGQITESGENSGLVPCVFAALKSGGQFLVEVPQCTPVVSQLKQAEQFGEGERYTAVTRLYNPDSSTINEQFTQVTPEKTKRFHLQYRLYDQPSLVSLLREAGFEIQASYGSYDGAPLSPEDNTMLIVATKP